MPYTLVATAHFLSQAEALPQDVYLQLWKQILLLEQTPRHPSLRSHAIKHTASSSGGKVFEGYVNKQYRFTWEYGTRRLEIILHNVDNHDEYLRPLLDL